MFYPVCIVNQPTQLAVGLATDDSVCHTIKTGVRFAINSVTRGSVDDTIFYALYYDQEYSI